MWVFNEDGFFSVVMNAQNGTNVLVRARVYDDLINILGSGLISKSEQDILITPDRDYPFRLDIDRAEWSAYMQSSCERIDYTNFKKHVMKSGPTKRKGYARAHIYTNVWGDVLSLEQFNPPEYQRYGFDEEEADT